MRKELTVSIAEKKWTSNTLFQAASLAAAVIAIVATVFFSIRSEKSKELTLTTLAKRPLLSSEASTPKNGLEVLLRGEPVTSPWLVSLRIENTGELPIEGRDIESPLKLTFQNAKPLSVETQAKSDRSISVTNSLESNSITVQHKLLNPNDWISIDILFDGEPSIPPTASTRISGIKSAKTFTAKLTSDNKKKYLPIPTPIIYTVLGLTSSLAALGIIGGVILVYQTISEARRSIKNNSGKVNSIFPFDPKIRPSSQNGKILYAAIGEKSINELLKSESTIRDELEKIHPHLLQSINESPETAAESLKAELLDELKIAVAQQIYRRLPAGKDRDGMEAMKSIDTHKLTPAEIIDKGNLIFTKFGGNLQKDTQIDKSEIYAAIFIFVSGIAVALISIGGWSVTVN